MKERELSGIPQQIALIINYSSDWRRLDRRTAFFFSIRRSSLLETCQRLLRTIVIVPALVTCLRKRRSRLSSDSFGILVTRGISHHLPLVRMGLVKQVRQPSGLPPLLQPRWQRRRPENPPVPRLQFQRLRSELLNSVAPACWSSTQSVRWA